MKINLIGKKLVDIDLDIKFEDKKVEALFANYDLLRRKIGKEMTMSVKKHIIRLEAAPNFSEFLLLRLGKPHSLSGRLLGCYAVSATANYRLILAPVADNLSSEALRNCTAVIVKGVDEYHDGKNEWIVP